MRADSRSASSFFRSSAKGSLIEAAQARSFRSGVAAASAIFLSPMRQASTFWFSRAPPQSGQTPEATMGSSSLRWSLPSSERMMLRYMRCTKPSYLAVLGQPGGGSFSLMGGV